MREPAQHYWTVCSSDVIYFYIVGVGKVSLLTVT